MSVVLIADAASAESVIISLKQESVL